MSTVPPVLEKTSNRVLHGQLVDLKDEVSSWHRETAPIACDGMITIDYRNYNKLIALLNSIDENSLI